MEPRKSKEKPELQGGAGFDPLGWGLKASRTPSEAAFSDRDARIPQKIAARGFKG
jgi:hypothetical protein